jgi:hypothetical protein
MPMLRVLSSGNSRGTVSPSSVGARSETGLFGQTKTPPGLLQSPLDWLFLRGFEFFSGACVAGRWETLVYVFVVIEL